MEELKKFFKVTTGNIPLCLEVVEIPASGYILEATFKIRLAMGATFTEINATEGDIQAMVDGVKRGTGLPLL